MDTRLLDLLVCPVCKGPLTHQRPPAHAKHELLCRADRLAFPVHDGIPVMLENQARPLDASDDAAPPSPLPAA
ncbi:MAG: hypothetical protein RJA98_359 [Pseudomonadota bacterium]|jgi:uncharacterized protein YbaR (Trm112 family)